MYVLHKNCYSVCVSSVCFGNLAPIHHDSLFIIIIFNHASYHGKIWGHGLYTVLIMDLSQPPCAKAHIKTVR